MRLSSEDCLTVSHCVAISSEQNSFKLIGTGDEKFLVSMMNNGLKPIDCKQVKYAKTERLSTEDCL